MKVGSPIEIGQLIRSRREARGLTQAALAKQLGASRKWVMEMEGGKTTAEIGRILQALAVLGVALSVEDAAPIDRKVDFSANEIPDVGDVLASYHRGTR
jgi:y4mF family transcriptional regulator